MGLDTVSYVAIVAVISVWAIRFARQTDRRKRRLAGGRFSVVFFRPNGSAAEFEGELINSIKECGGSVYMIDRRLADTALSGGNVMLLPDTLLIAGHVIQEHPCYSFGYKTNWKVDFRCFSPSGEIIGAGAMTSDPVFEETPAERIVAFAVLANELIRRIHLRRDEVGAHVRFDDSKEVHLAVVPRPSRG